MTTRRRAERPIERFDRILALVAMPGLNFEVTVEGPAAASHYFLRVAPTEGRCNVTGEPMAWKGRKWRLSRHMEDGEIVQTAFLAVRQAQEHELREQFTYKGVAVFGPHFDIERLVELAQDPTAIKERDHEHPSTPPLGRGEPPASAASCSAERGISTGTGGEAGASLAGVGLHGDRTAGWGVGFGGGYSYPGNAAGGGAVRRHQLEEARRQGQAEARQPQEAPQAQGV